MILAQAFARFVLDLDGVVWTGDRPVPGSPETVRALREAGKRLCFVTNNSSELPESYAKRLADLGADGDPSEVVSSADAVARVLERDVPGLRGRACYVVGGIGLVEAVRSVGVRPLEGEEAADASVVVAGWDRALTFEKLRLATVAIRRGAYFVASNTDATYPAADGLWPGAGAIVAALRVAGGVEPIVAGKPQRDILDIAEDRLRGSPALVVGDRVETDVLAARAKGWPAALVLSGATNVGDLAFAPAWPDYVLRRLSDLLEDLPHARVRPAAGPDLPQVATLLHDADMHVGAARERIGRTVVAEADRKVVATAGWEKLDEGLGLLRSVAVAPALRGKGLGSLVVAAALRAAAEAGMRTFYLVTRDAEAFFARCGFRTVRRDEVPDVVASHPQLTRECPATAPVMRLSLPA